MHFYDFVAIQNENNFLPTSKHRQAQVRLVLGIFFLRITETRPFKNVDRENANK